MNIFDELAAQYNEIDQKYASQEFHAASRGWAKKEAAYRRKRELNDQAYFLFMFSRLEDRIRKQSAALIAKKQASLLSWKQRAAWDILPKSAVDDLHFMKRLALLVKTGNSDYNLIATYYKERNSIAHGGGFNLAIFMPTVILELKRLYKVTKA